VDILKDARHLVSLGTREITLLGQNVNAYHGISPASNENEWGLGRLIYELAEIDATLSSIDLEGSTLISRTGNELKPFVFFGDKLYLQRYFQYETNVIELLKKKVEQKDQFEQRKAEIENCKDFIQEEISKEEDVYSVNTNLDELKKLAPYDIVVTSKSSEYDFISRYFWPANGGDEDPVTGSIHTGLAPYWAKKLDKNELIAHQASKRGGLLKCKVLEDKVIISGQAVLYLEGYITI
jgi:hypothetical protein